MKELLNNDSLLAITERLLGKKIGKDNIYKIQQAGTKYVGHVYFDVADDFLYECIVQTTGTTNTTANFKKTGVRENEDKLQNLVNVSVENISISEVLNGVNISSAFRYNNFLGSYIYIAGNITVNIPDNSYLFKTDIKVNNIYPLILAIDIPTTYVGQGTAWLRGDGKVQLVSPFSVSGGIYSFYTTVFIPK